MSTFKRGNYATIGLIEVCEELSLELGIELIRTEVAIHDIGTIVHLNEINRPATEHEAEGEKILFEQGVSPKIARVFMSHARWKEMECSTEELLNALSDKL